MTDRYDLNLYAKVAGLRLVVLANRLNCTDERSRKAHDQLEVTLGELAVDLREILAAQRRLAFNTDPTKTEDLTEQVWGLGNRLRDYWAGDPIPLLDYLWVDHGTREYFHPQSQRWFFLGDHYPLTVDLTDKELCGLGSIISRISAETGLSFSAHRVFYGYEADALRDEDLRGPLDGAPSDDLALAGPDTD